MGVGGGPVVSAAFSFDLRTDCGPSDRISVATDASTGRHLFHELDGPQKLYAKLCTKNRRLEESLFPVQQESAWRPAL